MSFTLWFTGLSASGKSTVAKLVEEELRQREKDVHNLDGDNLRKKLHPDLGFTEEERFVNNKRIATIASLLNQHNIPTIVAAISPFKKARKKAREIIGEEGEFILIHADCSIEECKKRDPKGLYKKAEEGKVDNFTGINHPYQEPNNPEIRIDTENKAPEENAEKIISYLEEKSFLEKRDRHTGMTKSDKEKIKEKLESLGYL